MKQPTIEEVKERIHRETELMKKSALATLFNLGYGPILEQANDYYHHAGMGSRPKADVAIVRAITGLPLTAEEILDAYGQYLDGEITLREEEKR